jgi:hypothetical protein
LLHALANLLPRRRGCRFVLRPTLLHHQLRFKHHLPMALAEFWLYLAYALPCQLDGIRLYQVQRWVRPACMAIDTAVLSMLPTAGGRVERLCDDQHAGASLVMVFCYVAMALLFSINFIYWEVGTGLETVLASLPLQCNCLHASEAWAPQTTAPPCM